MPSCEVHCDVLAPDRDEEEAEKPVPDDTEDLPFLTQHTMDNSYNAHNVKDLKNHREMSYSSSMMQDTETMRKIKESDMCMTTFIRQLFDLDKWIPLLVYIHANEKEQRESVNALAASLLGDDTSNFSKTEETSKLKIPWGAEIIAVPALNGDIMDTGVVVSPQQHLLTWTGEVSGEQFFVYFPKQFHHHSVEVSVQYFYNGVLIGEVRQTMVKQGSGAAVTKKAVTQSNGNFTDILMVFDDSDAIEQLPLFKKSFESLQSVSVQFLTMAQLFDTSDISAQNVLKAREFLLVQFFVSNHLLANDNLVKSIELFNAYRATSSKPLAIKFCCSEGNVPSIPIALKRHIKQLTCFRYSPPDKLSKLAQMQKNSIKAMINLQFAEFPIYSYILTEPPVVDDTAANATAATVSTTTVKEKKGFFKKASSAMSKSVNKVVTTANTVKEKLESITSKKMYVGFMCEDAQCECAAAGKTYIHDPFEVTVASDFLVAAAPYLKMMRFALQAAKFASTCAGLPIPFSIPPIPDVFDTEKLQAFTDNFAAYDEVFGIEDKWNASIDESDARSEFDDATSKLQSFDAMLQSKRAGEGVKAWAQLLEKHAGSDWVARTSLQRVVILANGNVKWVCPTCYEKRWSELEEKESISTDDVTLDLNSNTSSVDVDVLGFFQSLESELQHDPASIAEFFHKEGITSISHLLFIDSVWKVDGDFDAVRSIILQRNKELSICEVNTIINAIQAQFPDIKKENQIHQEFIHYLDSIDGKLTSTFSGELKNLRAFIEDHQEDGACDALNVFHTKLCFLMATAAEKA